jgi:hypothetical protein
MLIKPVFSVTEEEEGQTPEAEGELSPPEGTPVRRSGQRASRSGGSTCGTCKQQPRSPRARAESGSRQVGSARQLVTASAADVLAHSGKSLGGEGGASKLLRRLRCGAHMCPGTGLYPVLHAPRVCAASPDRPSTLTPCVRARRCQTFPRYRSDQRPPQSHRMVRCIRSSDAGARCTTHRLIWPTRDGVLSSVRFC